MASLDRLTAELRLGGIVRGRDLAARLGVSPPTLSRLVAAAGDQVCRLGRARASRYALTRLVPTLGTQLPVRRVDEAGTIHPFGVLRLLAGGRHWLERADGGGELFEGLPPFACDMSPQGYIGRGFSLLYPELGLPPRILDWNDDHRLIALARRGEDCVGNLIVGDESFSRFLATPLRPVPRNEFPECARRSLEGQPGSSAGGEQPKFGVCSEGHHFLVKFASGEPGSVTERWKDLLVCEREALAVIGAAGLPAAQVFDIDGIRFLQVERFDRVGERGRRGTLSLLAIGAEYLGYLESWTRAAGDLLRAGHIDADDARKMRWLDTFGQLIGNTDRHFGNLSFFWGEGDLLRLAPAYDMLPMVFAPQGTNIVDRRFEPRPPTAETFDVWPDAVRHAVSYWSRLAALDELTDEFRDVCRCCQESVEEVAARVPGS